VVVGEDSEVGANTSVHAGVVIGRGCSVGVDAVLHPHVVLYDDCVLGDRTVVHAGAVIGADGFGYRTVDGRHEKVPQLGWVEIGDDVEVGAGTTIDRGTFGPTRIGAGTKIDNLVMVAHNCRVGRDNLLAAQAGIAGSSTTGDGVVMGGQSGAIDHVVIGDRTVVGAQTAVLRSVPADGRVLGYPARPAWRTKRVWVVLARLPEMRRCLTLVMTRLGLRN
jgi:UDP-3-O-[3-hydroxymyristoyl] glucosamine N-acyltransferase